MPYSFRNFRLWTLVSLAVLAVITATALRAVPPEAAAMATWPQSSAM